MHSISLESLVRNVHSAAVNAHNTKVKSCFLSLDMNFQPELFSNVLPSVCKAPTSIICVSVPCNAVFTMTALSSSTLIDLLNLTIMTGSLFSFESIAPGLTMNVSMASGCSLPSSTSLFSTSP